jgi:GTPase SAR1 family protein
MDKANFVEKHVPTVVDNYSRSVGKLDYDGIEREITLHVKDIGNLFIENADKKEKFIGDQDAFLICFDLTDEDSFDRISKHISLVQSIYYQMQGGVPTILVGCKKDLEKQRVINFDEAEKMADCFNCPYIEASAKQSIS